MSKSTKRDMVKRRAWARRRYASKKETILAKRCADRLANPAKVRARDRAYQAANPEKFRGYWLKRKYGMTPSDLDALFDVQGRVCAICKTDDPPKQGRQRKLWHVDHCHKTGVVRGILCGHCNRALGSFRDNPELLHAAIEYLARGAITIPFENQFNSIFLMWEGTHDPVRPG